MPIIGVTNCRKLEDYRQSVLHVGGEVLIGNEEDVAAGQGLDHAHGVTLGDDGGCNAARQSNYGGQSATIFQRRFDQCRSATGINSSKLWILPQQQHAEGLGSCHRMRRTH